MKTLKQILLFIFLSSIGSMGYAEDKVKESVDRCPQHLLQYEVMTNNMEVIVVYSK